MSTARLFVLAAACVVLGGAAKGRTFSRADPVMAVISAAHDNGYREGFLAGKALGGGGERLEQCNAASMYEERRARLADSYEHCIKKLQFASTQGAAYLRGVANECVAQLPLFAR